MFAFPPIIFPQSILFLLLPDPVAGALKDPIVQSAEDKPLYETKKLTGEMKEGAIGLEVSFTESQKTVKIPIIINRFA